MAAVAVPACAPALAGERALVAQVVSWFGLGPAGEVQRVAEGLMNRNWRVLTSAGRFAVKQVSDVSADAVRAQHKAVTALAHAGLPVPAPVTGPGGATVLEHSAGLFAVVPWAEGRHRGGLDLSHAECGTLGTVLGQLHRALAEALPAAGEATVRVTTVAAARERIGRHLDLARQKRERDDFDRLVLARLRQRAALLESMAHLRPDVQRPASRVGWTHGDFHDLQVLWQDGQVSAVLDWDRLGVRPLAAEVVRSGTLLFGYDDDQGLDTGRVTAFTRGYRAMVPLTSGQLEEAAERLWWERLCDVWQLAWHYDRGDHSCDHLFSSASALAEWWCGHRREVCTAFTST